MTKRYLNNNFQSLEEMDWVTEKCVRCNMCKFPPLARVESKDYSIACPSFDYFKFHSNSGGGKVIMSNSLLQKRSSATEAVQKAAYGCALCGACDVSCKFNSDIEVLEVLFMLRHKMFLNGKVYAAHKAILENIRKKGHPLAEFASATGQVPKEMHRPGAKTLVWVGPHFAHDPSLKSWLTNMLNLMEKAKIRFQLLLDDEPYAGRAALEIGDRALFRTQSEKVAAAIRKSGAKKVVCLSAEDYSTLRSQTPKFAEIKIPVHHVTEIYEKMVKMRAFKKRPVATPAPGWHDPGYLGRLGGRFTPWEGTNDKEGRGIRAYVPERIIDYGTDGVFEAPRKVLAEIAGRPVTEFSLKKEYGYSAGETGQAVAVMPDFVSATAEKRIREAVDQGIETLVTECPQALRALNGAAQKNPRVSVISLTELMSRAYL